MTKQRMNVQYLARELGTASGWNGDPGECIWFYDFEPKPGVPIQACPTFLIDEGEGNFDCQDGGGTSLSTLDIIETLRQIPKLTL